MRSDYRCEVILDANVFVDVRTSLIFTKYSDKYYSTKIIYMKTEKKNKQKINVLRN